MELDYGALERGRDCNYWTYDPVLRREVRRTLTDDAFEAARGRLADVGESVGTTVADNSDRVDENPPTLETYDRDGQVINEVSYHPDHLESERLVYEAGAVADAFRPPDGRSSPLPLTHNLAMGYLVGMVDIGLGCPLAMTAGAALVLEKYGEARHQPYLEGLLARAYDDLLQGAMFLTERQGGSDVGKTETVAEYVREDVYELTGEKWFCSNLDGGCVLTLARRPDAPAGTEGLSLFLLPREPDDGGTNDYYFRRLKDKLGTKSVPTGEVELRGAEAYLVGDTEAGFKPMAEMLNMERLHTAVGSVGITSRALLESRVHVEHREVFGDNLVDKPLMRRDLVDMAVDHEAATAFTFDAARAFDRYHRGPDGDSADPPTGSTSEAAYRLMRMLVPVAKYRTGRLAIDAASYALEIQGGNGYVRDWVTHRLLRDAQVQTVWEGTSNVLALDVLRAMATEAAHRPALDRVDASLDGLDDRLADTAAVVADRRDALGEAVDDLATADRDVAERAAKAFADEVYEVYAAALLLAEADRDLRGRGAASEQARDGGDAGSQRTREEGDARKALVARWFVDRHLRASRPDGVDAGDDLVLENFEALNYFERVDPSVLE